MSSATATPKTKPKTKKATEVPEDVWIELQAQYESGTYSQRDIANLAKSKGYTISQSTISRRIIEGNWVKGSVREEITKRVIEKHVDVIGQRLSDMLENHRKLSVALISECVVHLAKAKKRRESDPEYSIAPAALATLTTTMERAMAMEAKAVGWNYREGRPFTPDDNEDEESQVESMRVEVMTQEDVEAIQKAHEAEAKSLLEGEEGA